MSRFRREFPDESRPHAAMLIQSLVPLWQRLSDAANAEDEDEEALLCMCERVFLIFVFHVLCLS